MKKIKFFTVIKAETGALAPVLHEGEPLIICSPDNTLRLILAFEHGDDKRWRCYELYTGLLLVSASTKKEMFGNLGGYADQIFKIDQEKFSQYWDRIHGSILSAYLHKEAEDIRNGSGRVFGGHPMEKELVNYISAPSFREAIINGKD